MSDSYRPHGLQPTRLLHPWDSPGKSTGEGCTAFSRNGRLTVLKTTKMVLMSSLITNFKMTVRADCAVFVYNPLPQSIKALACRWGGGRQSAFGQASHPGCQHPK